MATLINVLILLIAVLHLGFMYLEMVLWTRPYGLKVFNQTLEQAKSSEVLAANQGLYNGFLAMGLLWAVAQPFPEFAYELRTFFLVCVGIAGTYGGYTVSRRVFFIQALPAAIALALINIR